MATCEPSEARPRWYARPDARWWRCTAAPGGVEEFHRSVPGYVATPLVEAPTLAEELGVRRVFVKDESSRLGLPAFKILGVSWAVSRAFAANGEERAGTFDQLLGLVRSARPVQLITATAGNHGRAVARVAALLGLSAHVYVPQTVRREMAAAIRGEGAEVTVVPADYDDAVREAATAAAASGGLLMQDTAWPGYERIPQWIVDGYSTLFREVDDQLRVAGAFPADVLVVPMGVGSLAQAAITHYRSTEGSHRAALLGVQPECAACVMSSLLCGERVSIRTGVTNIAGLKAGTPSSIAWTYLSNGLDAAVTVGDEQAAQAVQDLSAIGVDAGPSGAASLAATRVALIDKSELFGISDEPTVVLLSTEARQAG